MMGQLEPPGVALVPRVNLDERVRSSARRIKAVATLDVWNELLSI
jgi:hypothetical protein